MEYERFLAERKGNGARRKRNYVNLVRVDFILNFCSKRLNNQSAVLKSCEYFFVPNSMKFYSPLFPNELGTFVLGEIEDGA